MFVRRPWQSACIPTGLNENPGNRRFGAREWGERTYGGRTESDWPPGARRGQGACDKPVTVGPQGLQAGAGQRPVGEDQTLTTTLRADEHDRTLPLRRLAQWTLESSPLYSDDITRRQVKLLILDSLGCALAALPASTPRHVMAMVDELGGRPECTLIGGDRSSILNAVLVNGALVRSLDFNDVQFFLKEGKLSVAGHCSDNIPVALATAERFAIPVPAMLDAIAMGYELFRRLRSLMPFASAWDGTSVSGMVAAAIAGRMMGLDEVRQAHALALAASRCATPSVVRWGKLSGVKNLANAMIAQSGTMAALLAARGVTGPLEVLDHRGGLHQVFDPALGLETLWAPVTAPLYVMTSAIKPFACIGTAQTTISAALDLHPQVRDRIDRIARIEVTMADLPMIRKQQGEIERRFPRSREAADHSFTFLPAVAMVDGAMTDAQFDAERWRDPLMQRLIGLTEMKTDPGLAACAPDSMPSRLRVTFDDGSSVERESLYHPGHSFPGRGLDDAVVVAKFRQTAAAALDVDAAARVAGAVMALETGDVGTMMSLLRKAG